MSFTPFCPQHICPNPAFHTKPLHLDNGFNGTVLIYYHHEDQMAR